MQQSNFSKLFRQSLINLVLLIIGAYLADWAFQDEVISTSTAIKILITGALLLYAEIMGVIGFVKLIRRGKEKKDYKYFIALIINGLITLLLIFSIINVVRGFLTLA